MIAGLLLAAAASWGAAAPTPQRFDYFTLALDWQPTFCARVPDAVECRQASPKLTLHGLWPDRAGDPTHSLEFCGVDQASRQADRPERWCMIAPVIMSSMTSAALDAEMPGRASCLERHEWLRHGTCSGLSSDAYFSAATGLGAAAMRLRWADYLLAHAGKKAKAAELLDALAADLGPAARDSAGLYCRAVKGQSAFSELKLRLRRPLPPPEGLKDALIPAERSDRGDCPADFLVPAAAALPASKASDILRR